MAVNRLVHSHAPSTCAGYHEQSRAGKSKRWMSASTGVPLGKRGLTYFGGACALRFLNFNFWEPVRSRFQDLTSNF